MNKESTNRACQGVGSGSFYYSAPPGSAWPWLTTTVSPPATRFRSCSQVSIMLPSSSGVSSARSLSVAVALLLAKSPDNSSTVLQAETLALSVLLLSMTSLRTWQAVVARSVLKTFARICWILAITLLFLVKSCADCLGCR